MKVNSVSMWNVTPILREFSIELVKLDKAHKRAKKELRKQQKALAKKNEYIKCYKEMYNNLAEQHSRLIGTLEAFQDSKLKQCEQSIRQLNDISNLELKITCLEQENAEKELQERIIKSMNNTIVELRAQLNETEEKYLQLLKRVAGEDEKIKGGHFYG